MIYNRHDVIRIVARTLNCAEEQLNGESGLTKTLNWDSLNHIIILTNIEEYFEIKIKDEMLLQLSSIDKIMSYLDSYKIEICVDSGKCECEDPCYYEKSFIFSGTAGVELSGVYCFTTQVPKGFILFSHGIPSEKDEAGLHKNMAAYFAKKGFDSFRFDFRYMGESTKGDESTLSIDNLMEDLESAYNFALQNPTADVLKTRECNKRNQFVVGTSCGAGLLIKWINKFKHNYKIQGAYLCCPVLDYVYECTGIRKEVIMGQEDRIINEINILGYIDGRDTKYGRDFFRNALLFDINDEMKNYGKRVVIFHGNQDQFVPFEISQMFYNNHVECVDLIEIDWTRHGFGVPLLDKKGMQIPNSERYRLKMKYQSDIIHSIYCSFKGVVCDGDD